MLVEATMLVTIASFLLGVVAGSYRSAVVSSLLVLFISVAFSTVILSQFTGSSLSMFGFALLAYNFGLMAWALISLFAEKYLNITNA